MSTEFPTKNGIIRQWHLIDAQDVVLGKLASKAAMVLMGKTKPSYTPFIDAGDHVIVINAAKVKVTGRKEEDRPQGRGQALPPFHRISRWAGGKEFEAGTRRKAHPHY